MPETSRNLRVIVKNKITPTGTYRFLISVNHINLPRDIKPKPARRYVLPLESVSYLTGEGVGYVSKMKDLLVGEGVIQAHTVRVRKGIGTVKKEIIGIVDFVCLSYACVAYRDRVNRGYKIKSLAAMWDTEKERQEAVIETRWLRRRVQYIYRRATEGGLEGKPALIAVLSALQKVARDKSAPKTTLVVEEWPEN